MKWNKFRLKTTTQAEDIVSSMLMELGIGIWEALPSGEPETHGSEGIAHVDTIRMELCPRRKVEEIFAM